MAWPAVRKILLTTRLQGGDDDAPLNQPITDLETRTDDLDGRATELEGRATELEGRATELEGRATELEGRATVLESDNVWRNGIIQASPSNFFFSFGIPTGGTLVLEVVIYRPGFAQITTAHIMVGYDDVVQIQVIASLGDVITPIATRSGGNIQIACEGIWSAGQLRARARQIVRYTP